MAKAIRLNRLVQSTARAGPGNDVAVRPAVAGNRFLTFAAPVIYSDDTLWPRILAVLCMREDARQTPETVERYLDSTLESVDSAEELAVGAAQRAGFDEDDLVKIGMAVRESMVNAVVHGNRYNANKRVRFSVANNGGAIYGAHRGRRRRFRFLPASRPAVAGEPDEHFGTRHFSRPFVHG
jgi:hypothetical protein